MVSRLCSNDSSVLFRCPTPRKRARGPYGYCLFPPACRVVPLQASPRSPGSRAWSFQTCVGSTTTQDRPEARASAPGRVAFRFDRQRRRPDCNFSKLDTQPICAPVYASPDTSRCPVQNSGPSGSLLLSREALSSSTPCRFIPAHGFPLSHSYGGGPYSYGKAKQKPHPTYNIPRWAKLNRRNGPKEVAKRRLTEM